MGVRLPFNDSPFTRIAVCIVLYVFTPNIFGQTADRELKSYIEKVDQGQVDEVKKVLPDLVAKYQNNAGVMYLQGRLASDGIEAVKFYQGVVDNFPRSEWADDALYRIYQYYYSLGLYRTAELKMQQLKKDYPTSPYLTGGKDAAQLPHQEEAPVKLPTKEVAAADTQQTVQARTGGTVVAPYTLQVGAFSSATNAEKQKSFFEDLGYSVEIANKIRSGRSLYLVWIGSYKNAEEARTAGKDVKTKYKIDSIIVEKY